MGEDGGCEGLVSSYLYIRPSGKISQAVTKVTNQNANQLHLSIPTVSDLQNCEVAY